MPVKSSKPKISNAKRPNSSAVIGGALGDEGKGRTIDNLIQNYLKNPKLNRVFVVRYQGGSNAGHSLEANGVKWAQHQVPSGVHRDRVFGIMDAGMVIHPEDLVSEIKLIESATGTSLKNKLFLSDEAIVCSDLDRAREVFNRALNEGAKGGTGRGIGPAYASHYDRSGLHINDLFAINWQDRFTKKYSDTQKILASMDMDLATTSVPDFSNSKHSQQAQIRTVGNLKVFIERLASARKNLIKRNIVTNTFQIHQQIYSNTKTAVLFEASQAVGLHPWLGTYPDVTASDTSLYGIQPGTKFWRASDIEFPIGVIKANYTSSVGARQMPTHVNLPYPIPKNHKLSPEQKWADYVRTTAHEFGSTTGRPRDILRIDTNFIKYNVRMGGIEALVLTHMDIAREDMPIQICTAYQNNLGEMVNYQPGLTNLDGLTPVYTQVASWDGESVMSAKTIKDLPQNAIKYIKLIHKLVGVPIVAITTGPDEHDYIEIPGYF